MFDKIIKQKVDPKRIAKTDFISEIKRCKFDPSYFAKNYIYIKTKQKGAAKFKLWDFQETTLKQFQANRMNIVLKSRQLGLTELMAMYVLWFALFNKDKNVVIVSKNRKTASDVVKRIKYAYKKLPVWLKIAKLVSDNVYTVEFDNDSIIFADATTDNAGRGTAASLFIVDEAAFIPNFDELWATIFPTIDGGGSCIINSTPNGSVGMFYELYTGAPDNGFNAIFLDWNCHPDRDDEWFEKTKKSMSAKKFAQEYLGSFLLSGDTVIDGADIARHELSVCEPQYKLGSEKELWIWRDYNPSHRYLMGVDVSRGDGEDFSAFTVFDIIEKDIVCEYRGKIKPDRYAELLYRIGSDYGDAVIAVENNGYGLATLLKLIDLKYPHIYGEEKDTKDPVWQFVDWDDDKIVAGFTTRLETRVLAVDKLEESIRLDVVKTYSKRMISEFRNFIFENGKPKARKNSNDDLVMSLAITLYVTSKVYSNFEDEIVMKKTLLEAMKVMSTKLSYKVIGEKGFSSNFSILDNEALDPYTTMFKDQHIDFRCFIDQKNLKSERVENKGIEFLGVLR
jgi:hypothetical protein